MTLIGRLTRDPEIKYTKTGKAVASFSVATDEGTGDNKKTTFTNIVAWQGLGEAAGNSLTKGNQVFIHGRINSRSYDAKDGSGKRYVTEVVADFIGQSIVDAKKDNPQPEPGTDAGSLGKDVFPGEEIPF